MYRSDSSRRRKVSRSRASHAQHGSDRLTEQLDFSQSGAGHQFGRVQFVGSYDRTRPEPQYITAVDCGYVSSLYSTTSHRTSSATYASANELPSLGAHSAEATHRDRVERKMKAEDERVRLDPKSRREGPQPQPSCVTRFDEVWCPMPPRTSTSFSGQPSRSASLSSRIGYMSPPPKAPGRVQATPTSPTYQSGSVSNHGFGGAGTMGAVRGIASRDGFLRNEDNFSQDPLDYTRPSHMDVRFKRYPHQIQYPFQEQLPVPRASCTRFGSPQINYQHEHVHSHFHHIVPSRSLGKDPTFISRDGNGNRQFERCLNGRSHTR